MPGSFSSPESVRFTDFEVDLRAGELRKHGVRIRLQDQPFRVLQILLEHPGEVVPRKELQDQIWPSDTFVDFERGLNNAVKRLREALADSAEQPRYIETLPKRGYRFIAHIHADHASRVDLKTVVAVVESPEQTKEQKPVLGSRRWPRKAMLIVGAAAILLLSGLALLAEKFRDRVTEKDAIPSIHSVAVLPLQNLSGDPSQEYFADGMTDALITDLAQIGSLKVISRTTSAQYKKTAKPMPMIAHELNVDGVVEGTVQRSGDHVRITVQLVDGPADRHLWANSYDRDLRDVLLLEQDVASAIATEVRAQVRPQEETRLKQSRPVNPQAIDAYLQGRYHLDRVGRGRGYEDTEAAIEYLELAVREDPGFATAYAWLGHAYEESFGSPATEMMPRQKAAEVKALELDPQLAQAHRILGTNHLFFDWDWPAAENELRQAIELEPSSAVTRSKLATYLAVMGRSEEAFEESERARELDPANEYIAATCALFRQYDRAIAAERGYLAYYPNNGFSHWTLFEVYALKGMQRESIEELEQTWKLFGFEDVASAVHQAYRGGGFRPAMRESGKQMGRLHEQRIVSLSSEAARYYAFAGDNEQAIKWLETALNERDGGLVLLNRQEVWDPLRSDPRFREIVRRVGLPK